MRVLDIGFEKGKLSLLPGYNYKNMADKKAPAKNPIRKIRA